jgi:hypothetical protein
MPTSEKWPLGKKRGATSEHRKNGLADRLIVATAIVLGVPLVTVDQSHPRLEQKILPNPKPPALIRKTANPAARGRKA